MQLGQESNGFEHMLKNLIAQQVINAFGG